MFQMVEEPLDIQAVVKHVSDPAAGAVVTFVGTVRDHARGKRVLSLEYEAYPEMAERMLQRIHEEIRARWDVCKIAVVHRMGRLQVGEVSVVIAVSSAHREEAFKACRYAIDRTKEMVPIWKKEVYEDGECWIGEGGG